MLSDMALMTQPVAVSVRRPCVSSKCSYPSHMSSAAPCNAKVATTLRPWLHRERRDCARFDNATPEKEGLGLSVQEEATSKHAAAAAPAQPPCLELGRFIRPLLLELLT
mmetsp:Transcript_14816/g.45791  ORF Transcript_14816/g.45791 Transcript_14816/m.45791 type:complete len:109 (+) Transcript_14816:599-925(+)